MFSDLNKRFIIYPSEIREGYWVCVDKEKLIILIFQHKNMMFNQFITFLEDNVPPELQQKELSMMALFLRQYHKNKIGCDIPIIFSSNTEKTLQEVYDLV